MSPGTEAQPIRILLVEDSDDDVLLTRKALRSAKVANELHVETDGEAALHYLRGGAGDEAHRPDLVLLDLNLPRMDGREVLEEIKRHPTLRTVPVIVLTTSSEERDILRAYDAHVNAYVTKPLDFGSFIEAVRSIEDFWLRIVKLPQPVPAGV